MRPRVLILPAAAVVIAGLVVLRMQQEQVRRSRPRPVATLKNLRPAPSFLLSTPSGGRAKLAAYLGRTKVVLFFTGGETELAGNHQFTAIAEAHPGITAAGAQLVVVTPAAPQEVRRLQEERGTAFPFPVLSDIDPERGIPTPAHQIWGLRSHPEAPPEPGLFLIDRAGNTEFTAGSERTPGHPQPVRDVGAVLGLLTKGEWPP